MPNNKARVVSETRRTKITFTTPDNAQHEVSFEEPTPGEFVSEELDADVAAALARIDGYAIYGAEKKDETKAETKPEIPDEDEGLALGSLKAVELRQMAERLGVDVGSRDNKKALIKKINAAVKKAKETTGADKE